MTVEHAQAEPAEPKPPDRQLAVVPGPPPVEHGHGRWFGLLGLDLVATFAFLIAMFASGIGWFIIGVIVCGPLAGVFTFLYLALSSDMNRSGAAIAAPGGRASRI